MATQLSIPRNHGFADRAADALKTLFDLGDAYRVAWQRRRKLAAMLELDDRVLDDVGVIREDIYWALDLPLKVNAGPLMHQRALARRRAERRR